MTMMPSPLEQFRHYRDEDKHECNLLLSRINALLTSQSLFVAAGSFLYSNLQNRPDQQQTLVTAVGAIAVYSALHALIAIYLGCQVLRRWHRHGEKIIDRDAHKGDLTGLYLLPRRHQPDLTHFISVDLFGYLLAFVFIVFWVLAIVWVQGWLG
jgi:hypothetical protein